MIVVKLVIVVTLYPIVNYYRLSRQRNYNAVIVNVIVTGRADTYVFIGIPVHTVATAHSQVFLSKFTLYLYYFTVRYLQRIISENDKIH